MTRTSIDIAVVVAYLLGTTLFGCLFYSRGGDADDFKTGGGKLPAWALSISIFATYVSSISFLAIPAKAYLSNWNALVLAISIPFAAFVAAKWFVPFYRRNRQVSAYSFLESRFGYWARAYASSCYLIMQVARSGMILLTLALLMQSLLGLPMKPVIVIVGLCTLTYSMFGGFKAVVWTDAIQGALLVSGALLCLGLLVFSLPNGLTAGFGDACRAGKLSLGSFTVGEWGAETFWVTFLYGIFLNLQTFGVSQSCTQRYVAARSDTEAVRSMLSGALMYIPVMLTFVAIGTLLWIWAQGHSSELPASVVTKSDAVLPWFIVNRLPVGVSGLVIAAVAAAAMSTVSATFNCGATVLEEDFRRRFRGAGSAAEQVRFLRLATAALGLLSIGIAFCAMNVQSVLTAWWGLQSVIAGGMLGLFLLGAYAPRTHAMQAAVAVISCSSVIAWVLFGQRLLPGRQIVHLNLAIVLGTVTTVAVGFSLCCISFGKTRKQEVK